MGSKAMKGGTGGGGRRERVSGAQQMLARGAGSLVN